MTNHISGLLLTLILDDKDVVFVMSAGNIVIAAGGVCC